MIQPEKQQQTAPFACAYWPWRLALASYMCLPLTLLLSVSQQSYASVLQLPGNLVFSAACLLGLTLLVAAALSALFAVCNRLNLIDFIVLLVTLPPLGLHAWGAVVM